MNSVFSCSLSTSILMISTPHVKFQRSQMWASFWTYLLLSAINLIFDIIFYISKFMYNLRGLCCVSIFAYFCSDYSHQFPYWNPFKCDCLKLILCQVSHPQNLLKSKQCIQSPCLKFFNEFLHYSGEPLKPLVYKRSPVVVLLNFILQSNWAFFWPSFFFFSC